MELVVQACIYFLLAILCCWAESIWERINDGQGCMMTVAGMFMAIIGAFFGLAGIATIVPIMEVHMVTEIAIRLIIAGLLFLLVGWLIDRGKWYLKLEDASGGSYIGGAVFIIFGLLVGLAGILSH